MRIGVPMRRMMSVVRRYGSSVCGLDRVSHMGILGDLKVIKASLVRCDVLNALPGLLALAELHHW